MKPLLLPVFAALAILASILTIPPSNIPFNSIQPIEATVPAHVQVFPNPTGEILYTTSCTATSINEKKHYWLTAAHCVMDKSYQYRLHGSLIFDVVVNTYSDIAIITTPGYAAPAIPLATSPPTSCKRIDDPSCKISVTGYPLGWTKQTTTIGTIAVTSVVVSPIPGWSRPLTIFQIAGGPGMSGSAVLSRNQEIVSIIQMAWGYQVSPLMGGVDWQDLNVYRWYWKAQ